VVSLGVVTLPPLCGSCSDHHFKLGHNAIYASEISPASQRKLRMASQHLPYQRGVLNLLSDISTAEVQNCLLGCTAV
jgi:hypothetical protein